MAKRALFRAVLIMAAAVPVSAGHAADAPQTTSEQMFAASFSDHQQLPVMSGVQEGAVDVTAIVPPVEVRAAGDPLGRGEASYYADKFNGRRTASGETFRNSEMTAAHRTLPFGTRLRVTNPATGASVIVRVNDRGPFHPGRSIDVSRAAAQQLGLIARGHGTVEMERLD